MGHWFLRNGLKQAIFSFVIIPVTLFVLCVWGLFFYAFHIRPLSLSGTESYWLKPGQGLQQMAFHLSAQKVLPFARIWLIWAKWRGNIHSVRAGQYALEVGMTPWDLLLKLEQGDVIKYRFRLGEGWTFAKIKQAAQQNAGLIRDLSFPPLTPLLEQRVPYRSVPGFDFPSDQKPFFPIPWLDSILPTFLNFTSLEGLFFADTYEFTWGHSFTSLLKRAHDRLQQELDVAWQDRALDLPYQNAYEALIAASIIEKETAKSEERFQIAGVLVRRLFKKMPLQMDPTVIYGLGEAYNGRLTHAQVHGDTLYNTYLHTGLPPTPIGLVSAESIQAALHPAPGNSLYFVARGDGSHEFSDNLSDHNRAVARLIRFKKNRNASI